MNNHQEQLFTHFDFTVEDLHANREGNMTKRQQQQLEADAQAFWKQAGLVIVVVVIGTILGSVGIAFGGEPIIGDIGWSIVFGVIVMATLAFLVWFYQHKQIARAEARTATVTAVSGTLRILESAGDTTVGRFKVGRQIFAQLSPEQFDLMQQISELSDKPQITIYCTPQRRKLMSIDLSADDSEK